MAGLGLKSIAYMAEKFPDKWMEKIPYYRTKEEDEKSDSRSSRHHSRRHSHSHKSSRKHRRDDYYDDDCPSDEYESDGYDDRRGGRRHHRSNSLDGERYASDGRSGRRRPYNPADYVPVDRTGYAGYPTANSQPAAAGVAPGVAAAASYADTSRPTSSSGPIPGYIPYAHVYSTPSQSQYTSSHKPAYYASSGAPDYIHTRDSRRSSEDRYARDYRAEPRFGRYSNSRYDPGPRGSRDYDSDSDVKYRRRGGRYD